MAEVELSGLPLQLVSRADSLNVDLDHVYLVGGAVRDLALGVQVTRDVDLVFSVGDASQAPHFVAEFAESMGGVVIASHRFGTSAIGLPIGENETEIRVDMAMMRGETYAFSGALPTVFPTSDLEQDLFRRDITINAMALPLRTGSRTVVVDPFGGMDDINSRLTRVLHDQSFTDDPTRIFRVIRYASRYSFDIEENTRELIGDALSRNVLSSISKERIRTEIQLIMEEESAAPAYALFRDLSLDDSAGFEDLKFSEDGHEIIKKIDAAVGTGDHLQDDLVLRAWRMRIAAMFFATDPSDLEQTLARFSFRARDIRSIVEHHATLRKMLSGDFASVEFGDLRDLLRDCSDETLALASIVCAPEISTGIARYRDVMSSTVLKVTGNDIRSMGLARGPKIGEILEEIYERKLAGELPDEEAEYGLARRLVEAADECAGGSI